MNGPVALALLALALATAASPVRAAERGMYTAGQAQAGRAVYASHCAQCHGAGMQGGTGPALVGEPFERSLAHDHLSAPQLFDFITSHMPAGEPGLLADKQYLQAFAHLLARNGYPAGDTPLTKANLGRVKLLSRH